MIKHKFLFWASLFVICSGLIVGFQNQTPNKIDLIQNKKSTLDYFIPDIQNNSIVKSIESSFDFGFNPPSAKVQDAPVVVAPRTVISAMAYGTYFVDSDGSVKNLLGQNLDTSLRIASITKLMTALVAMKNMDLNKVIEIEADDIGKDTSGRYKVGDRLTLQTLLYSLLIESDNDVARAIANNYGNENFVQMMNGEAQILGMSNTKYFNSSGVDSDVSTQDNVSTVSDLAKLTQYIELKYPNLFAITALSSYKIMDSTNNLHHVAFSTDKLIDEFAVNYMVGGKTGYTGRAKQNLLILRAQNGDDGYYVDTVLDSDDRFGDMKLLISKIPN